MPVLKKLFCNWEESDMVEMKTLGDVTTIVRGNRVTKADLVENGEFPVISGGVNPLGYIDKSNREPNTITIAQYGTAGYVNIQRTKFWANDVCYSVYPKEGVHNEYLYYALMNVQDYIYSLKTNAVPAHLPLGSLQDVQIPIPSKEEQTRIVEVLDTFTASIANLKEQIKERRKQYEYYRDQLLDLEGKEGVEMKTLGEVCQINRGVRVVKKDLEIDGTIPVFQNSLSPLGYYEKSNYPANTTFVISAGAAGDVGFSTIPFWAADDCLCVSCFNFLLNKYVFVFLQSKQIYLKSKVRKGAVPRLSRTFVEQLEIPIVSIQEQTRIVTILDQFEASIANLEAQLKEREKQYEYYRNQLLTFE